MIDFLCLLRFGFLVSIIQANSQQLQRNLHEQICSNTFTPEKYCEIIGKNNTECVDRFTGIRLAEFCDSDPRVSELDDIMNRRYPRDAGSVQLNLLQYINAWSLNLVSQITHYGCWCYFDEKVMDDSYGRGPPIAGNIFDELCKHYKQGFYRRL